MGLGWYADWEREKEERKDKKEERLAEEKIKKYEEFLENEKALLKAENDMNYKLYETKNGQLSLFPPIEKTKSKTKNKSNLNKNLNSDDERESF